jgi:hypothetical protein
VSPGVLDGSFLRIAHPVLDFGEGLLDRIEVWRIGRQEPQPGACCLDQMPDGRGFVAAEIVHDDDVARVERFHQFLLDIGAEAKAVDRPVEDAGGCETMRAERAEEGHCAPMAVRGEAAEASALWPPAPDRRHIGLDPSFVDEDEAARIDAPQPSPPALAFARNIDPRLLKGEDRFF